MTPFEPAQEELITTFFSQKSPRPVCRTAGRRLAQPPEAVVSNVARNSQVASGWIEVYLVGSFLVKNLILLTSARVSPPTWKSVTLSVEKSTVKLPHGAVSSKLSSKPIVGG